MEWSEVLADPSLQDLPYKVETNQYGQIVMSPASNEHGYFQVEIASRLREQGGGRTVSECSILTADGVKVADVAWGSADFARQHAGENPYGSAPELCVEIASPGNKRSELDEKRRLYFEAGAQEVWECDLEGRMTFYGPGGPIEASGLFPGFPTQIG